MLTWEFPGKEADLPPQSSPHPKSSTPSPEGQVDESKDSLGSPMTPFVREGRAPPEAVPEAPPGNRGEREGGGLLHSSPVYNLTPTEAHWLQAPGHQDQEPIASLAQCWPGLFQLGRVYLPKKKCLPPSALPSALRLAPGGWRRGGVRAKVEKISPSEKPRKQRSWKSCPAHASSYG